MKISVVTVCFNDEVGLRRTLDSIRAQTARRRVEVIIVDGGSSDRSFELAKEFEAEGGAVSAYSGPDLGIYDAQNKGAHLARGEYVIFLNSGDVFSTASVLSDLEAALEANPAAIWLVGLANYKYRGHEEVAHYRGYAQIRMWLGRQVYNHQCTVFKRSVFSAIGGHDLQAGYAADADLMLKFGAVLSPIFYPGVVATYDAEGRSSSMTEAMPLVFHSLRVRRLGLRSGGRAISSLWGVFQVARRRGFLRGLRISRKYWLRSYDGLPRWR